ncbi:MAG: hypothetical protein ACKOPI_01755 [bacterium]
MERAARNRPAKPGGLGILAAAGAAVALGVLTAWLMAPKAGISPEAVDASDWFDAEFLASSASFRSGQRWLFLGQLLAQTLFLLALVIGPLSKRLRERLTGRAATRPVFYGTAVAALILFALQTVGQPSR